MQDQNLRAFCQALTHVQEGFSPHQGPAPSTASILVVTPQEAAGFKAENPDFSLLLPAGSIPGADGSLLLYVSN